MPAPPLHHVAVLVLEGAKPLDVGIPAQVFTTRASMPYEVRVCGAAPGLVAGGDGLSYYVAHGLEALAWADIVFVPGYRHPDRDDPPQAVVDALIAAHHRGARLAAISTRAQRERRLLPVRGDHQDRLGTRQLGGPGGQLG
ncbi:hypothetical protein AB0H70_17945, partial [Streptomyces sp. NPDC050804]